MPSFLRLFLLLLVLAASPSIALAQGEAFEHAVRVTIDNDLFAMRSGGPDDHDYTHGTRLGFSSAAAPSWLRFLSGDTPPCRTAETRRVGCVASSLEIGQQIYTPRVDGHQPVPGERPYSGWLFVAPALHRVTHGRVRSVRLHLGVTGPGSFAEQAQNGMHALLGEHRRPGWDDQLKSEVGLALAYDDRVRTERSLGGRRTGAASIGWGAVVGNVRTALHAGVLARIGMRADLPWSPEELEWRTPARLYAIAGVRQELVVRDLFVDGNTFHESVRADRIPFVSEIVLGAGVRREGYALEYRWVRRGREYEAQPRAHAWGSIGVRFDRR